MNTDEKMLVSKLSSVRNSYQHFVDVTIAFAERFGIGAAIADYIDENPDATASDVIKERIRLVHGDIL